MSAPFASSPVPAPNGAKAAWVENVEGKRNVWIAQGPEWTGHPVTSFNTDDGEDIDDLAWAPNGSYLLFVRGGDFEHVGTANPNPNWNPTRPQQQIWHVATDSHGPKTSDPKMLTEGHAPSVSSKGTIAFLRGGQIFILKLPADNQKSEAKNVIAQLGQQNSLQWSPDGSELAFVSARGTHSFIGVYTPSNDQLRYMDASVDRDSYPAWSPDGAHLAYVRVPASRRGLGSGAERQGEPWSIRIADVKTGVARQIFKAAEGPGSVFHALTTETQLFWTAGGRLVFPWERSGWSHLYSLPLNGETPVELTPGEGEVEQAVLCPDAGTIYFSSNLTDIDRRHLWSVSPAGGSSPKAVTSGEEIEMSPSPVADNSAVIFLSSSFNQRSSAMVRLPDGKTKPLAEGIVPSEFPAASLVKPQAVMITAADGTQIHGQLFLPPHGGGGRHPAIVFFHGGSRREMLLGFHYRPYYSNAYALNEYLASQGYVVLSVNYRSGIGYGLNFREAIHYGAAGGSEMNDVIGAGLYLKNRPDVEPNHIGVWGGSYGGYLTAMALSRASDLFSAGVDFHGVHDWSNLRESAAQPAGGDPKQQREYQEALRVAFESSPMASVDTWKSPVLLIHGDDDRNVSFSQSVVLVEALRQRHVEFEQLILPNEIHEFLLHRSWVTAYQAAADFFARKLR
ncbi:MAG TPA: prolyl oligopeptidase family serine peptidase [Bryobacteraceae bacterium]|nr:prolyl oligopeptidase family serine peptidase [Bryobacteraceae bacterium]